MAYVIEQKIGRHIYLYEVTSYWDPEKKQPRQKRKYIGKKDPKTGSVITPHKSNLPRLSKEFGNVYLLNELTKQIGLKEVLEEVFGEMAQDIINLAHFSICEGKALYLYKDWSDLAYISGDCRGMDSQEISRFLRELGEQEALRERFIDRWFENQKDIRAIVFDITSFSSYSKNLELLEWGYNRDGEELRQINFGVIMGSPSSLPIGYRIYPGSITDVVTLKNVIEYLKGKGLKKYMFVLDRGFYSDKNIGMMNGDGIEFIIPMPFSTNLARGILSRHLDELGSAANAFMYEDRAIFHSEGEVEIERRRIKYHIYSDEKRKAEELEGLIRRLTEIEEAVKERGFRSKEEVEEFIEGQFRGGSRFFEIRVREGKAELKRKGVAISRRINIFGKMILLCSVSSMDGVEVLSWYRRKDFIEKAFEVIKNEIDGNRLRVRGIEAMEGRLFVMFIALILYTALSNRMKENEMYKRYTLSEVLYELKKIKVVEMLNGKRYLTEVTKKQRAIYEKLRIPPPVFT